MNNAKDKFWAIVVIVLLIAFSVIILAGFALQLEVLGNYIEGLFALIAALIAVVGVSETIKSNQNLKNQELLNSLDQKSEWRKELMNIAAKPIIELEDILRILASLRFLPKSKVEIEKSDQPKFDEISNYIYKRLNEILNDIFKGVGTEDKLDNDDDEIKMNINKVDDDEIKMNINKNEEIRLYTKFLLKHHWEYNKGEDDKEEFKKKELEEFKKVMEEIHRLNQEDNIKKDYYKTDKIYTGDLEAYAKKLKTNSEDK